MACSSQYFRDLLYQIIIMSKSGLGGPTLFDFKYVPQLGKSTGKEDLPSQRKKNDSKRLARPAERFLLLAFLVQCALFAATLVTVVNLGMLASKMITD